MSEVVTKPVAASLNGILVVRYDSGHGGQPASCKEGVSQVEQIEGRYRSTLGFSCGLASLGEKNRLGATQGQSPFAIHGFQ